MGDDIAAFKEWASIFLKPAELSATIAKNLLKNKNAIHADVI